MLEALARRVSDVTGCPIVGGVAVMLHGGGRHTYDIDVCSEDLWESHQRLVAAGIPWDNDRREHLIEGVPVHLVRAAALGGPPGRISTVRGIRVLCLADLVRVKLALGLDGPRRAKDIAHVVDLIQRVPLGKDFAAKLPPTLRVPFKRLVEDVSGPRRTTLSKITASSRAGVKDHPKRLAKGFSA
jgi:hypothetical protein